MFKIKHLTGLLVVALIIFIGAQVYLKFFRPLVGENTRQRVPEIYLSLPGTKVEVQQPKIVKINNRGDIVIHPAKIKVTVKKDIKKGSVLNGEFSFKPRVVRNTISRNKIFGGTTGDNFVFGVQSELFHYNDYNLNIGVSFHSRKFTPCVSLGYSINQHSDIFVGYNSDYFVGVGVRF